MPANDKLVFALPNGRILTEVLPLLARAGIVPEAAFSDPAARQLRFATNDPSIDIVRTRAFDVATYVAFGAAHVGVAGNDVLMEFDYDEIYAPAETLGQDDPRRWSHVVVATKYPNIARRYFARRGIQAECIRLSGAIELAPALGLCTRIVDLVSTGATLKANGLVEVERIADITSRLIVNRAALKTRHAEISPWIDRITEVARAA